jgi:8-oxo-dGTP pyrophosphatase MutT (NUDIX family)
MDEKGPKTLDDLQADGKEYLEFVEKYRKIRNLPLGGTRSGSYKYSDPTSKAVLSVGVIDDRGQLPFRVALSTFKLSHPITSYGCIIRHRQGEETFYLLIKRSDTIEYTELLRGGYRESQLFFLLRSLSNEERERILKYRNDFDTLWIDHMGALIDRDIYHWSKNMFGRISKHLDKILEIVPSTDPEGRNRWLFPKGKLEYRSMDRDSPGRASPSRPGLNLPIPESPWECAQRELLEETHGLSITNCRFVLPDPIQEVFLGSNSKNYATSYFVLESPEMLPITQFSKRSSPIREVSTGEVEDIVWVNSKDLDQYLPPRRLELIRILEAIPDQGDVQLSSHWLHPVDSTEVPVDDTA